MHYSTPVLIAMGGLMVVIAYLVGLEPWMIGVGAIIAAVGFFLERRRD